MLLFYGFILQNPIIFENIILWWTFNVRASIRKYTIPGCECTPRKVHRATCPFSGNDPAISITIQV